VLASIIFIFYLRRIKLDRLKKEEIENTKFWKKKHAEEEKRQTYYSYLEPKPKVLPAFTTHVKRKVEENKIELEQPSVNVDLDKVFYKRKRLNKYEIDFLLSQGYKEFSHKSIATNKNEKYILRPRFNESLQHLFFIYDAREYLEKKNISVEVYITRMPDLVFKINGNKFALEVETGSVLTNMKKFNEKLNLLNKNYEKNWFFIVTNRNLMKKYRKFGKVIDPRFIKFNLDRIIKNAQKRL
jgi:hypothetical protein